MTTTPSPSEVRAQLIRILASPGFANAERMRRFLTFTVEAKLRGEQDQIKEFTIGREVFDRDGEYDPRTDPIVRVEARRLRTRLDEYYAAVGAADPVRIELPKGSYVPALHAATVAPAGSGSQLRLVALGVVVVAVISLVAWFALRPSAAAVAVLPASWIYRDQTDLLPDESLAEMVTAEIANRRHVPVIAWPLVLQQRGVRRDTKDVGQQLRAQRVLILSIRRQAGASRVTAFLLEPASGQKQQVKDYYPDLTRPDAARETARQIAADLETAPPRRP